jgi:hypothetical protein
MDSTGLAGGLFGISAGHLQWLSITSGTSPGHHALMRTEVVQP